MTQLEQLLQQRFGLPTFRPGQREVIEALLDGESALAVFPTGGGKSLCYQLPALLLDGITLVVSPLIALMKDQIDALQQLGIPAARLDSTLSAEESLAITTKMRRGELSLVYVAPERFNNERFLETLSQLRIALFAVDEAHCISEWGHNFRPDYLKLANIAQDLGVGRVLALTATATPQVVHDICQSFAIAPEHAIVTGFYRPNLFLRYAPTPLPQRTTALIERLRKHPPGSGIVYVTLQRTAEEVADALAAAGISARAYHAGMGDEHRADVQEWWKASNQAIVVATIAFGMGIDKPDVRYIYHYNLPKSLESYSQEIGRAGRDGQPSLVEMLGGPEDQASLEHFAYGDTPTPEALTSLLEELFAEPEVFSVALVSLSHRHDIRLLVLRTALTYLELQGILRQGTPYYAGYSATLQVPLETIISRFQGERASFIADIFAAARLGKHGYRLDLEDIATAIGQDRQRIVRALEYLHEQQLIELSASQVRQRYTRLVHNPSIPALVHDLQQRFERREQQEILRVQQVLDLMTHAGCQSYALLAYFGEQRQGACGKCSFCRSHQPIRLPALPEPPPIHQQIDYDTLARLCQEHPTALGHARQRTRFLCGLSSPALTQAKLSRHPLFGQLETYRFADVLAAMEQITRN